MRNIELHPLYELALDLRQTSSAQADELWGRVAPELWNHTRNPWLILQTLTEERWDQLLRCEEFQNALQNYHRNRKQYLEQPGWFQEAHGENQLHQVAYFSMEYGASEALPIYSGGLGILAGDHLKSASDLGVPIVAIGVLFQQGYFRQVIDANGAQKELYPTNSPQQLPIEPVVNQHGEWLALVVSLPGRELYLRCWRAHIGKVRLYLLDSNLLLNSPADRGITSELYGGNEETRLQQEMVLGIGGWRLLHQLGIAPEVCHLNEGHAAFAVLERARCYAEVHEMPYWEAWNTTRSGNLFTTHTPVSAGFDRFSPALMQQYLGPYAEQCGVEWKDLMALGRSNSEDSKEPFNMAHLAIRGSTSVNGVSRLHGEVSRHLFAPLYPGLPIEEVPIGYVTNGVHVPSWGSSESDQLWNQACGLQRWSGTLEDLEETFRAVPDTALWDFRNASRSRLVEYTRRHLSRSLSTRGSSAEEVEMAERVLDPETLTLGFARRFTNYKRPNLLLYDRDRLLRILCNAERPVQLVLAGKAHPHDEEGKHMIWEWMDFILHTEARQHVVFLGDYDILVAERLVQGVDVWVNTPRRPWEASGTSGMKVLVNGGLNLSELDGWWAEAYEEDIGWALGDGKMHNDDPSWDAHEADWLYSLLEEEVAPLFYRRDERGVPEEWLNHVRESMARLTPQFSTNRMVREYVDDHYIPLALEYTRQSAQLQNIVP